MTTQKLETQSIALAAYAAILAVLNVFMGVLVLFAGLGIVLLSIPPFEGGEASLGRLFAGVVLIVIGIIFAIGTKGLVRPPRIDQGAPTGPSFLTVGAMLSAAFGLLDLLIMGAHWIMHAVLASEDFMEWTWRSDFNPTIWLFFLAIPALIYANSLRATFRASSSLT
jgi:cytochrome c biogenesis protein CcdA